MGSRNLVILLVLVLLFGSSCTLLQKNLAPLREERPVTLFDRYILDFKAQAHGDYPTYVFRFSVDFAEEHARYLKRIDTIPILRIDSVCVFGGCVDIETCSKVVMRRELRATQEALEKERITGKKVELEFSYSDVGIRHRTYDLYINRSENTLGPESFISVGGPKLPVACNDSTGTIILHMRLLDRTTKKVIASEARSVGFKVSTQKVWYNRPHHKE